MHYILIRTVLGSLVLGSLTMIAAYLSKGVTDPTLLLMLAGVALLPIIAIGSVEALGLWVRKRRGKKH